MGWGLHSEQADDIVRVSFAVAVCQETVVANALKAFRQNVEQNGG